MILFRNVEHHRIESCINRSVFKLIFALLSAYDSYAMSVNSLTFQRRTDIPDLLVPVQCRQHLQSGPGLKGLKKC